MKTKSDQSQGQNMKLTGTVSQGTGYKRENFCAKGQLPPEEPGWTNRLYQEVKDVFCGMAGMQATELRKSELYKRAGESPVELLRIQRQTEEAVVSHSTADLVLFCRPRRFESCKDDLTCARNWLTDFDWNYDGNHCRNSCVPYSQMYKNGRDLCQSMWGQSFTVSESPCRCLRLDGRDEVVMKYLLPDKDTDRSASEEVHSDERSCQLEGLGALAGEEKAGDGNRTALQGTWVQEPRGTPGETWGLIRQNRSPGPGSGFQATASEKRALCSLSKKHVCFLFQSSAPMLEKHGEHFSRGEGRFGVSRRRHNSSDGFFNNGPLHTSGDGWQQPSLLRHDSVDSGVSKGPHAGLISNQGWKENSSWHSAPRGTEAVNHHHHRHRAPHRHWNGSVHPRKGPAFQEKQAAQAREEKGPKGGKLKFVEEDFAGPWKPNGREMKSGLHFSGRDSAFTSPVSVTKPLAQMSNSSHTSLKEGESSTPEPKEYGEGNCHKNGLSLSLSDSDTDHLSSSLEAEHRLLKAMGWQEHPENDENCLPLTEDELKEFQAKTEQLKKNGFGKNGLLLKNSSAFQLGHWRSPLELEEGSETETSSSETSADET
ncbi:UNVERIFIED_CONTAM: hypothetical protein FKN15_068627 [Acipenser sinensis]